MELSKTLPDATTLAREHRSGERDPRATVRASLQRAHALQERLNAFAVLDDEGSNARATEIAAAIARGDAPGPLAGVPVSVKDILDVAGLPTRWGSLLMAQAAPAKSDIAAVARLRAAGAVVIGKTTTTEFAHSPLGFSPLTGLTRNPWAPELTCGGSSAGAGVAAAAGLCTLCLATDAGCSTRLPAACTGVFGVKPTLGTAPHDRVPEAFANFIHLGLLAREVNDLAIGLDVIAGASAVDPHSLTRQKPNAVAALAQSTIAGARVLLWMRTGNRHVADEIIAATHRAAGLLATLGARVTEEICPLENPDPVWRVLQQSNWAARFAALEADDRAKLSSTLNAGIDAGLAYRGLDLQRALIKRTGLFRAVQGVFQSFDFILTPCVSAPPVAAEHDLAAPLIVDGREAGDLRTEWTPYLSLFDLTGHPAITMPAGLCENGAPLGVQLVAPWAHDAALLAAAAAYERVSPPLQLPSAALDGRE
ncbi:MAG TPA: amidase family protein [Xanthobacteraceae bacterium]|jgi:aspartyl-tRNA(Asn)/glutamyl-tRNA(Gln) amidotransferase subunit A